MSSLAVARGAGVMTVGQPGQGCSVVLRRQPASIIDGRPEGGSSIIDGRPEGGYTVAFEIICCDCGDDPGLAYCAVSPGLQRVRGPYPLAAGAAAYEKHIGWHERAVGETSSRPAPASSEP